LLAKQWNTTLTRHKHEALFGRATHHDEQLVLLKPQLYMNRSGISVAQATAFYKVGPDELLVIVDDMALELGRLRLRLQGSDGGHNGLRDIIERLGHDDFARLRIGIGATEFGDASGHVLGRFSPAEKKVIDPAIERAAQAVKCWLEQGIDQAMNKYNMWI
jgi:PTH1 family peptidyl-tRNA hydrolase